MKNYLLYLVSLFFYSNIIFGQTSRNSIDSLLVLAKNTNISTDDGSKEILRLCTEVYYQSKEIGYEAGRLKAITIMAETYSYEGNLKQSLKRSTEGIQLAKKLNNDLYWSTLLTIEGTVFFKLGYYHKSRQNFDQALLIADKISDKDKMYVGKSRIYSEIATSIDDKKDRTTSDSAEFYLRKAYKEIRQISNKFPQRNRYIANIALNLGYKYFVNNNIPEAEKYLDEFYYLMKNDANRYNFATYYSIKGFIENKKKNYTKAVDYFNNAILLYNKSELLPSELSECYSGIAESYHGLRDYKNQAFYIVKSKKITDSLNISAKKLVEGTVSIAEQKENENYSNIFFIIGILFIIGIILGTIFYLRHKNIENSIEGRETNFNGCNSSEEEDSYNLNSKYLANIVYLAQNNDKSFHLKFLELFPNFNQKLLSINPQLTHSDLEYCALMKLKFDTKEISKLKNISVSSVESKKYRIRKKLNISSKDDIYIWLLTI